MQMHACTAAEKALSRFASSVFRPQPLIALRTRASALNLPGSRHRVCVPLTSTVCLRREQEPRFFRARTLTSSRASAVVASLTTDISEASPGILKMNSYGKEQEEACKAVRLAAELCKMVQRQLKSSEKADKEDASPVTIADYVLQSHLVHEIHEFRRHWLLPGTL